MEIQGKTLPALLIYNAGMSVNNTVAVFDAVLGKKNEFLRTPKYGVLKKKDDWKENAYNLSFSQITLLELFFGVYGILGAFIAIFSNNPVFVPIIALQTIGFFYIAYLSLSHTRFERNKSSAICKMTKKEKMANTVYKLSVVGIFAIIVFGVAMAMYGYNNDIYPLDRIRGNLNGIIGSSDPVVITSHLAAIQVDMDIVLEKLPETTNAKGEVSKNPVWIFPTETTNFIRIQQDVNTLSASVAKISTVPKDSSAYHTGMMDISNRAFLIQTNIMDATPYMYVSIGNIIFSVVWIAVIIGIFAALKKKRDQFKEADESGV